MSDKDLYDVAREVTDEVLGKGTYADMNRTNPNPGVQAAIRRAEPEEIHVVCHAHTARVGDRVRHYGQRYNYREGTATITGFEVGPQGYPCDWVKVLVQEDAPSVYGSSWDWDRTVVVSKEGA